MADIAVLGRPDGELLCQLLPDEPEDAYDVLTNKWPAFSIGAPPQKGEKGRYFLLSLDGKWVEVQALRVGHYWLCVDPRTKVQSGMSGSPIVSEDGKAIGVVSAGDRNPSMALCLPAWLLQQFRRRPLPRSRDHAAPDSLEESLAKDQKRALKKVRSLMRKSESLGPWKLEGGSASEEAHVKTKE